MTRVRDRREILHVPGVSQKRFERMSGPRRGPGMAHPCEVLVDLRAGSLVGLDRYLKQTGGIADREIAVELRKMLFGSPARTRFRLAVTEHPGAERRKGGRPSTRCNPPRPAEFLVAMEFEREKQPRGVEAAALLVAQRHGISARSVYNYARKVTAFELPEKQRRDRSQNWRRYLTMREQGALGI